MNAGDLTSLRADLVKQFMQLARLIGLPVTQVLKWHQPLLPAILATERWQTKIGPYEQVRVN
jgi:hypothetical protein